MGVVGGREGQMKERRERGGMREGRRQEGREGGKENKECLKVTSFHWSVCVA